MSRRVLHEQNNGRVLVAQWMNVNTSVVRNVSSFVGIKAVYQPLLPIIDEQQNR